MNGIGSPFLSVSSSLLIVNPIIKQTPGLEHTDTKQDIFSAVEETAETSANKANPDSKVSENNASAQPNSDQPGQGQNQQSQEQSKQELAIIRDLSARDREVRAHEQAHASVGGQYAGAASFTYQRGPNGVNYAVGGEVSISALPGGDAQSRLQAAEQIKRAALAPTNPSTQDRQVATQAAQTATQARAEIATENLEELSALNSDEVTTSKSDGVRPDSRTKNEGNTLESESNSATQAFKNVTNASDVGAILNRLV
jgi:hypothetical protein